ncbi:MAG: hypothetical protein JWQ42_4715 [Edaphobacter sp.]|nr:hypothetical protein [Edaphobacter sp.]
MRARVLTRWAEAGENRFVSSIPCPFPLQLVVFRSAKTCRLNGCFFLQAAMENVFADENRHQASLAYF